MRAGRRRQAGLHRGHRLLEITFEALFQVTRNVLTLVALGGGQERRLCLVAVAEGDLHLARLPLPTLLLLLLPSPTLLGKDPELNSRAALLPRLGGDASVDQLPGAALRLRQSFGRLVVRSPVRPGLVLELGQPFDAVRLCGQVDPDLAVPGVEVGEGDGLDDGVRGGWEEGGQVLVVIQVEGTRGVLGKAVAVW